MTQSEPSRGLPQGGFAASARRPGFRRRPDTLRLHSLGQAW